MLYSVKHPALAWTHLKLTTLGIQLIWKNKLMQLPIALLVEITLRWSLFFLKNSSSWSPTLTLHKCYVTQLFQGHFKVWNDLHTTVIYMLPLFCYPRNIVNEWRFCFRCQDIFYVAKTTIISTNITLEYLAYLCVFYRAIYGWHILDIQQCFLLLIIVVFETIVLPFRAWLLLQVNEVNLCSRATKRSEIRVSACFTDEWECSQFPTYTFGVRLKSNEPSAFSCSYF